MENGTHTNFELDIPYVGKKVGGGWVVGEGQFAILGKTYTVISDGSGDYGLGEWVEVKRSSMR
jgi:hypothetical protein